MIGYDASKQLDVEPGAGLCASDQTGDTHMPGVCDGADAALEPPIIEKGLASDRVVVATVMNK